MKERFLYFSCKLPQGFKRLLFLTSILISILLVLMLCANQDKDSTEDINAREVETANADAKANVDPREKSLIGDYTYPDNPINEFRSFLENDIIERGLPLEMNEIEKVDWDNEERIEFMIHFKNDSDNACVVSFAQKNTYYNYSFGTEGHDNPSFTIAFKDPDKPQDMITVLTSVILYLSPDLDLEDAKRLAVKQDDSILIDGYSTPQDIGGYQVQTHYTNPQIYFTTKDFTAKLGITITALKQIWGGGIEISKCQNTPDAEEFRILYNTYVGSGINKDTSMVVYTDFIVKDWWLCEDLFHGFVNTAVTVELPCGEQYILVLDSMTTPYEFGINEKYTFFIFFFDGSARIIYATQLTN